MESNEDEFSLKDFLLLCLSRWKWILLSIIFFGAVGYLYVARKEPVYNRMEEILVKDQESGGGIADVNNAFSQLGLVSSNTNVYNELISLTSPSLMYDVVERLDLTVNYNLKKGLHPNTLYGTNNPIHVEFPDLSNKKTVGFRITMQPNGTYTLSRISQFVDGKLVKYDNEISGKIGDIVGTPVGKVKITHNDAYIVGSQKDGEEMVIDIFKNSLQSAVELYAAKLNGDLTDQDADVIKLSIDDVSVQRADDILNSIITVYNERWIEDKNKMAVATSKFISERLVVIEKELGNVDDEISDYKSEMRMPDIEETAKGFIAQDFMMTQEGLKISTMIAMATYLKDYLMDPKNTYAILPMNSGVENPVLETQIAAYNEVLLRRNNLAENSSDDNPLVKDINQELAGMRNAIIQSVNSNIENLTRSLKNIETAQGDTRDVLADAPQKAKTLLSTERQQLVLQELYLFLLQKREENELSQTFTADNIRVITPPYGNQRPISPKKTLILIIALFLGFAVPASALFIAESANTKIRSKKDLENTRVPFAGEIPFVGKKRRIRKLLQTKKMKQKAIDKPKVVVAEGKRDIPNEAFRVVRSNIDFMLSKDKTDLIAITSFNPGSGKSFVAFNLGASFSLKGKRVLLIDGDLRHGSISTYVNSPGKGITNYLTGDVTDWKTLVKRADGFKDYDVLPIGKRPPNPAELLDNGRIKTLLEEARKEYQIVMIDCPPINIVVDTQIINQYVDRTIFVVRAGLLEKSALKEIEGIIEEDKLRNIAILLNGTTTEFSSYHTYGNYEAIDKK